MQNVPVTDTKYPGLSPLISETVLSSPFLEGKGIQARMTGSHLLQMPFSFDCKQFDVYIYENTISVGWLHVILQISVGFEPTEIVKANFTFVFQRLAINEFAYPLTNGPLGRNESTWLNI